jgi:hypothetical protein
MITVNDLVRNIAEMTDAEITGTTPEHLSWRFFLRRRAQDLLERLREEELTNKENA